MDESPAQLRLVPRYLDPASRLGEVLFGLIMVLTMTLTAGIAVAEGIGGVRELLEAAIGCNLAWGIIDAIMYIMNCMTERAEKARIVAAIRQAPNEEAALDVVRREIEPRFETLTGPQQREVLSRSILDYLSGAEAPKPTITRDDLYGAMACFWLVFLACLPAALPFFVIADATTALRVSNALLIGMLFVTGYMWGRYVQIGGLLAGLVMVAIGLALVGVAVLLGG